MTISAFSQWSTTASANVDMNNIPLDSATMIASEIDDAFREMMKQLKEAVPGISGTAVVLPSGATTGLDLGSVGRIKFPASQSASSDANTLDDYEELNEAVISKGSGISSGSGTITTATGVRSYTKVGRQVTVTYSVNVSSIGTGGTSLILTLPFTAAAAGGPWAGTGMDSIGQQLTGVVAEGAATVTVRTYDTGNPLPQSIPATFTVTYWV